MSNTYLVGEQTKRRIFKESKKLFYKKGFTETKSNREVLLPKQYVIRFWSSDSDMEKSSSDSNLPQLHY